MGGGVEVSDYAGTDVIFRVNSNINSFNYIMRIFKEIRLAVPM